MSSVGLGQLRRYAISRTLFAPTTLARALHQLGFVQADPIRAPARAQDLVLRQRVKNYRAGHLERRYPELDLEEEFFINYGFLSREACALMQPRIGQRHRAWDEAERKTVAQLLRFVRQRGTVHPREVEAQFALGKVRNYWGGSSSATTHLLDNMHYHGLLRIVRRDRGVRVYAERPKLAPAKSARERGARIDALVDLLLQTYAPIPGPSLGQVVSRLRFGVPQWREELKPALVRAKQRLAQLRVDGIDWYWPAEERPGSPRHVRDERVRLLAPFDPLVWDRRRFELFWGWQYRFEAYTPPSKRKLGYYALPLLWRDEVVGWGNLSVRDGRLTSELGFVTERPREPAFARELEAELAHIQAFLGSDSAPDAA